MPIIIYLVVFIILFVVTELTPAGRYFRGTGLNQFTSELSGIRIRMYTLLSYVICSLTAAILGLVLCASQSYASPDHGNSFMMDSLLAVLLGKTLMNNKVSIYATAFGALFLRSFENGLSMIGLPVTAERLQGHPAGCSSAPNLVCWQKERQKISFPKLMVLHVV